MIQLAEPGTKTIYGCSTAGMDLRYGSAVVGTPVDFNAVEGAAFVNQAVATFSDPGGPEPNPSDPDPIIPHHYTADINWGDDTTSTHITLSGSSSYFTVCHAYADGPDSYMMSATIVDESGCSEPSHGRVFLAHKDGYVGPVEINWPAHP